MNMTVEFILRILAAAAMGAVIGLEREFRSKEAGIRTHFLVAMGSALFMIISAYGFEGLQAGRFDVSRVAAQVVTGIGFLGAGVIIFQKNSVHGLTTAAGLWVTAAIGLGCGGGMYLLSAVGTLLVLIGLEVLHFVLPQISEKPVMVTFKAGSKEALLSTLDTMKERRIKVWSYSVAALEDGGYKASVNVKVRQNNYVAILGDLLDTTPGVEFLSIE